MFVAKNSVLSCFANGKATALVVDVGGSGSVVCPVHDGYVLQKSLIRSAMGGDRLTTELHRALAAGKEGFEIKPVYTIAKKEVIRGKVQVAYRDFPKTTASYKTYAVNVRQLHHL